MSKALSTTGSRDAGQPVLSAGRRNGMRLRLLHLFALVVVLAGCGGSSHGKSRPAGSAASVSPVSPVSSAASAASPSPTPTATASAPSQPAGAVPRGFRIVDATFVSTQTGWLLGTAPCAREPCTSIVRTTDGGRHWTGIPAPVAYLNGDNGNGSGPGVDCSRHACLSGLRFASPGVGYAFGTSALFMTTDGGRTWQRQPGGADALEVSRGSVLRVRRVQPACPGCVFAVERAAVGSATWHATSAPSITGDAATLSWSGSAAAELVLQNPAGGAGDAHSTLLLSPDGGATWTKRDDPCGGSQRQENDATAVATAADGTVVTLCRPRTRQDGGFAEVSADDGRTWRRTAAPAGGGLSAEAVAATDGYDLYAVGITGANGNSTTVLVASHDGGRSWRTVHSGTTANGATQPFVGFETPSVGRYFSSPHTLWSTSDAGAHWAAYTFR